MTYRLTKIDELSRRDHYYLAEDDTCYFYGEYTARKGYAYSETNRLIINLKKSVLQRTEDHYKHKQQAINKIAEILSHISTLQRLTFVPIPPSKCKTDIGYDDRLISILKQCKCSNPELDFRELVTQKYSTIAAHSTKNRPSPEEIMLNYHFNIEQVDGVRNMVVIFDDVLTAGSHYKAMKMVIKNHLPQVQVVGLFVARTVREAEINWFDEC